MRDFSAGSMTAGGDIIVNDLSNQGKRLEDCTIQELYDERDYRNALLLDERRRKGKQLAVPGVVGVVGIAGVALWQYLEGHTQFASFLFGLGQFVIAGASLRYMQQRTPYEERQMAALEEIGMLLRERGAR